MFRERIKWPELEPVCLVCKVVPTVGLSFTRPKFECWECWKDYQLKTWHLEQEARINRAMEEAYEKNR